MKADGSRGVCSSLIRGILHYVVENPDAKDTLDGINEFWLAQGNPRQGKHKVQKALDFLVTTKQWLCRNKTGAAVTLYGLNKGRLAEIQSFLARNDE